MSTLADPVANAVLDLISEHESNGNYHAEIGHINSHTDFPHMTISQVYDRMAQLRASGMPSTAVGRYQDIKATLQSLVEGENLDPDTTLFTDELQDKLNVDLLNKTCDFHEWRLGICSDQRFLHLLSCQWASLPDPMAGGKSHYDGDGVNHAGTTLAHCYDALAHARTLGTVSAVAQPIVDTPVRMAVRALQKSLNDTGHVDPLLTVDGLMSQGGATLTAYFAHSE